MRRSSHLSVHTCPTTIHVDMCVESTWRQINLLCLLKLRLVVLVGDLASDINFFSICLLKLWGTDLNHSSDAKEIYTVQWNPPNLKSLRLDMEGFDVTWQILVNFGVCFVTSSPVSHLATCCQSSDQFWLQSDSNSLSVQKSYWSDLQGRKRQGRRMVRLRFGLFRSDKRQ